MESESQMVCNSHFKGESQPHTMNNTLSEDMKLPFKTLLLLGTEVP